MDEQFPVLLAAIKEHSETEIVMGNLTSENQVRSMKMYGLLSSLVRNRALAVVKAVPESNGLEAWRQLCAALRPQSKSCGLAIVAAISSWPSFDMNKSLQAQILKLEEAFNESSSVGVTLQDDIRAAILLKCVSGNLRTQLNMVVSDTTTYAQIRENILKFKRSGRRHLLWAQTVMTLLDQAPWTLTALGLKISSGDHGVAATTISITTAKASMTKRTKAKAKTSVARKANQAKVTKANTKGKARISMASNTTRGGISNGNTAANGSNSHTMTNSAWHELCFQKCKLALGGDEESADAFREMFEFSDELEMGNIEELLWRQTDEHKEPVCSQEELELNWIVCARRK